MKSSLRPGLTGSLTWTVPIERTVPHLLPESPELTALPQVLATGYLVGVVEWTCIRVLQGPSTTEKPLSACTSTSHTKRPHPPATPSRSSPS